MALPLKPTEMGFVGGEIWAAGLGSIPLHHGVQCTEQALKITTEKGCVE